MWYFIGLCVLVLWWFVVGVIPEFKTTIPGPSAEELERAERLERRQRRMDEEAENKKQAEALPEFESFQPCPKCREVVTIRQLVRQYPDSSWSSNSVKHGNIRHKCTCGHTWRTQTADYQGSE